jgi:hypothetical protein
MPWIPGQDHAVLELSKTEYRWVVEQLHGPAPRGSQKVDVISELARALDNTGASKAIVHPLADFGRFRPGPRNSLGKGE